MKFCVWWKAPDGTRMDVGPCSLANAIDWALDYQERGTLLYITNEAGRRLTLKAVQQLKAAEDAQGA